jgi:hypothetical protein
MKYVRQRAGCTWDRSQTKTEIVKELNNPRFGQNTGLQEKMDTTCKLNAT